MADNNDYRQLKRFLNNYFDFSFDMPRKGRDFTPQQKAAITRKYNKIAHFLQPDTAKKITYIKYKKGARYTGVDGVRTSKGIFVNAPKAVIKRDKKGRYSVVSKEKKYIIKEILFPRRVLLNPGLIEAWVDHVIQQHVNKGLVEVMWKRYGTDRSNRIDFSLFYKYFSGDTALNFENVSGERGAKIGSIIGVKLIIQR